MGDDKERRQKGFLPDFREAIKAARGRRAADRVKRGKGARLNLAKSSGSNRGGFCWTRVAEFGTKSEPIASRANQALAAAALADANKDAILRNIAELTSRHRPIRGLPSARGLLLIVVENWPLGRPSDPSGSRFAILSPRATPVLINPPVHPAPMNRRP